MSSAGTIVPRYGSTTSGCSAAATPSALTITPSALASPASELPSTWVSDTPSGASKSSSGTVSSASAGAAPKRPRSKAPRSVNSHPVVPLKRGRSSPSLKEAARSRRAASHSGSCNTTSANGALHLQLDQPVHLDRVLHRELLDDRLDEAVDDQLARLLLGEAAAHQVEELLLADLGDRGLVADVDVVLADADRRVGVGARVLVEQQRVADDLGARAVGALGDLEQAAVRGAPAVLGNRLGEDVRRRVRRSVDDLRARVLVLALAGEGDAQDLAMRALAHQVVRRLLHGQLLAEVAVDPLYGRVVLGDRALLDEVE